MANLTRADILARKLGRRVVELADAGTVEIRGLSHEEVTLGNKFTDINERTAYMVSRGLVDPELSFDDVVEWSQQGAAGDIVQLAEAIGELSGLSEGAGKSGVQAARR